MGNDFSNVKSPLPSFSYRCKLLFTQILLCVLWIAQDLFHLNLLWLANMPSPVWVTGLLSHWDLFCWLTEKPKPLGQSLLGEWLMVNNKLCTFNNEFQRSHSCQNVQWPATCLWGAIMKRFLAAWVMGWKDNNATNSPPVLEKNVCTFLFILFVSVCDRLFSVTLCEGV